MRQHRTRNLEILRCAIAHRSSRFACPGMTKMNLRHCEPTGRRKAPPGDRLREASDSGPKQAWIASSLTLSLWRELPDGQISRLISATAVQPSREKYSAGPVGQINSRSRAVSSHRGAARDRHGRGTGCGGRGGAERRAALMRTAKSRGPDAPTLASSSWEASFSGMTVARKPGHRGERVISRKTIAQGRPDCLR
jgi:hypothetical protein